MANNPQVIDKSIMFPGGADKYGAVMFEPKEIITKPDTSTSIVVDWKNSKKMESVTPEKEDLNIVYKSSVVTDGENKGQKLDLHMNIMYHPSSKEPTKIILFIPGGGFMRCDINSSILVTRQNLQSHNFAVAAIEYHVVGNGFYYDALEDIKDAVEFLKKNEKKYNYDINKLIIFGNSAGGYFTALYTIKYPEGIKCAVDLYGLSDLTKVGIDYDEECHKNHLTKFSTESMYIFGCQSGKGVGEDEKEAQKANPVNYVTGKEPPFLFMHGDCDIRVSNSQTLLVHNKILEKGGKSTRYVLKGDDHGKGGFDTEEMLKVMVEFINTNVK
jgi:acetyl esterase/lipase